MNGSASTSDAAEDKTLRLRRCKSVTRAEEIQTQEAKARKLQPDHPIHRPRDSLFSWTSGFNDYSGFINWAFLLLLMGGLRLLLENLIRYGIRVDPHQWLMVLTGGPEGRNEYPAWVLIFYINVHILLALVIEKGMSKDLLPVRLGNPAHVINLILLLLLPIVVINFKADSFGLIGSTSVCMMYSVMFLKLWSYIQVNYWCRASRNKVSNKHIRRQSLTYEDSDNVVEGLVKKSKKASGIVNYPDNLNLKDIYYFVCVPTLCYELNFPRTDRIRKRFLMKRILEVTIGTQMHIALFQQWIIPSVKNSLIPFSQMDLMKATERLLKLAIPNHLLWLVWFYLFFHSYFNLLGELLHFADRDFYGDWWNSNNVNTFWRQWNLPVHRWAVRHLYKPLIEMKQSKFTASVAVFFTSAFFHEYLVSVPLRTFKIWAFMGMMSQLPLSFMSDYVEKRYGRHWSNTIVWASLILGQPLCIMMYYHDYVITHFGAHLLEQFGTVTRG